MINTGNRQYKITAIKMGSALIQVGDHCKRNSDETVKDIDIIYMPNGISYYIIHYSNGIADFIAMEKVTEVRTEYSDNDQSRIMPIPNGLAKAN